MLHLRGSFSDVVFLQEFQQCPSIVTLYLVAWHRLTVRINEVSLSCCCGSASGPTIITFTVYRGVD